MSNRSAGPPCPFPVSLPDDPIRYTRPSRSARPLWPFRGPRTTTKLAGPATDSVPTCERDRAITVLFGTTRLTVLKAKQGSVYYSPQIDPFTVPNVFERQLSGTQKRSRFVGGPCRTWFLSTELPSPAHSLAFPGISAVATIEFCLEWVTQSR